MRIASQSSSLTPVRCPLCRVEVGSPLSSLSLLFQFVAAAPKTGRGKNRLREEEKENKEVWPGFVR